MLWLGTDHLGEETSIFTGAFPKHYDWPDGFCFDSVNCNDEPIMDDPAIDDYNLGRKVKKLLSEILYNIKCR